MSHSSKQNFQLTRRIRNQQNKHKSFVIWFTGLSGSGKSTIANHLEQVLFKKSFRTCCLDGDNIRLGLNNDLGFSAEDRKENIRRVAEVGKLFADAGLVTIASFISPLNSDRLLAKNIIGREDFFEVYVNTPFEICEKRDVKGLYKKARAGEIINFTGIDAPYEAPVNPDFEIKTEEESVEESVQRLLQVLEKRFL